jgi:hypothetical protein
MQVGAYENFEGCILDGCLVWVSTLMQFLNNEQIERGAVWKYFVKCDSNWNRKEVDHFL